jgi:hypothetical protein
LGDPEAGDLLVDTGEGAGLEMSTLAGERKPGEAERLVLTLVMSLCTGFLSKLDPKPPNWGTLGSPNVGMTDPAIHFISLHKICTDSKRHLPKKPIYEI